MSAHEACHQNRVSPIEDLGLYVPAVETWAGLFDVEVGGGKVEAAIYSLEPA